MRLADELVELGHTTRLTEILRGIRDSGTVAPENRRWLGRLIAPLAVPPLPRDLEFEATTAAALRYLWDEVVNRTRIPDYEAGQRLVKLPERLVSGAGLEGSELATTEVVARTLRSYFLRSMPC